MHFLPFHLLRPSYILSPYEAVLLFTLGKQNLAPRPVKIQLPAYLPVLGGEVLGAYSRMIFVLFL